MIDRDDLYKQYCLMTSFAAELRELAESLRARCERQQRHIKEGKPVGELSTPSASEVTEKMARIARCEGRIDVMLNALYADESKRGAA